MSQKTIQYIRKVYAVVLSCMLIVTGILLMIACVNIYRIGDRPFTPTNISAAFSKIAIPVWITVALIVLRVLAKPVLSMDKGNPKAIKDNKITLARLQKKINIEACDENTQILLQKEEKLRRILRVVTVALITVAETPAVVYAFDFSHFSADYNASVVAACLWILPCTFVAMGIYVAFMYIENASVERQLKYVKSAIAQAKCAPAINETKEDRNHNPKIIMGIRIALLALALVLIVAGIFNGGMADVLSKAINICTECIGLG